MKVSLCPALWNDHSVLQIQKKGAAQNIKMAASPSAWFFRVLPASSFESTLDEKYQKPNKSVGPEVGHYIELKNE